MYFYTAHRRLSKTTGGDFIQVVEWLGFHQIDELVSADTLICPNLVIELTNEDWNHNVHADNRVFWFYDLLYLAQRIHFDPAIHNILSLVKEPSEPVPVAASFELCGYDILDSDNSISVLTNCGGFPEIFSPAIVNRYALLNYRATADDIANRLRTTYADDDHCRDCRVWSVCRYTAC